MELSFSGVSRVHNCQTILRVLRLYHSHRSLDNKHSGVIAYISSFLTLVGYGVRRLHGWFAFTEPFPPGSLEELFCHLAVTNFCGDAGSRLKLLLLWRILAGKAKNSH